MLVGLMSRMNAISEKNNASYALMRNHRNMMNTVRNMPYTNYDLETLHQMDTDFAINNDYNQTLLMLATEEAQAAKQLMQNEAKNNKISYIA